MEHRWSVRKPYRCSVLMEAPCGSIFATATDIGLDGMFLEIDASVLPLNAPVTVGFRLDDARGKHEFRLPAMVVRRAPGGIGILFLETSSDVTAALYDALYRKQHRAATSRAEPVPGAGSAVSALMVNG